MADFETLVRQAETLGLSGDALSDYVSKQQNVYREERAKERELQKLQIEAENQKVRLAHELEMTKIQANNNASITPVFSGDTVRPSLPVFHDSEDISLYLIRFERVADLLNIKKESYAVRLGSLLTGKAVDVYTSLSPEITKDYELLKKCLLDSFAKTPDGYRVDFRSAKIKPGETFKQFVIKLGRMFDLWVDASNVEKSYENLRSFMILDQLKSCVSPDIRMFLKENSASTLDEAARFADTWASAHGSYPKSNTCLHRGKRMVQTKPLVPEEAEVKAPRPKVTCHGCGEVGHIKPRCPKNPFAFKQQSNYTVNFSFDDNSPRKFLTSGTINGSWVSTILRDSGCSCVIVAEQLLPDVDLATCQWTRVFDYLGRTDTFPLVKCFIRCPYYVGWVKAVRAPIKFCSVLIGNIPGVRDHNDPDAINSKSTISSAVSDHIETIPRTVSVARTNNVTDEYVQAVETRSGKIKRVHPLVLPKLEPLNITPSEFVKLQLSCPSLSGIRCKANAGETENMRDGSLYKYEVMNGLIYRSCVNSRFRERVGKSSLVVPADCRKIILSLAHESPLAGHFSHRKTEIKVREQFYWPGMGADIKDYCRSCEKCQRMSSKGRIKPAPLQPIPIVTEPFSRVAIDIVGPLTPASSQGHKYILTLIDFATGFPDALPLKDIDSVSVAEALLVIFSRVGIPREILSDRGTQFTSKLMGELHKLLGIKPLFTTPYHPSCNGRIERFHSTLKASLRKLCIEKPKEWHRYLIPTLFALREIPSDRTAFSPFELLYGRTVRGPLSVLRDLWENPNVNEDQRSTYQYVIELKDKLADCAKIAAQNADISSSRYRSYFDLKSQKRHFKKGDEVLVLLPDHTNKLLMAWRGPFPVLEQKNKVNYLIDENGTHKLYHVNLLKKYYRRSNVSRTHALDEVTDVVNNALEPFQTVHMCLVEDDSGGIDELPLTTDGKVESDKSSNLNYPNLSPDLSPLQKAEIQTLIDSCADIFSDIPGCTSLIKHNIELTSTEIIRAKRYPIPVHLQSHFRKEVDKLYEQGIIRLSSSPYCSPVVMVKKADGTYRMAIDFRAINSITVFHAEPSCTVEEELFKFAGARYFSEIDLTKAYYQIPLSENAMPLTSFPTHRGLMEFTRLPFGLVTAGATYIRLMRLVLSGLSNIAFYFDNIFIYGNTWKDHMKALVNVLERLRKYNLTARLSKCRFGFPSVEYLGFIVDGQNLKPQYNKIEALLKVPLPMTKKSLRKFLGMISFYRLFIPNVSNLTSPLSDMLRKNVREPLVWSNENESKFEQLKQYMTTNPILKLPDINLPFALRTDASNYGVGAVLLQYVDDIPYPVAYASRKLMLTLNGKILPEIILCCPTSEQLHKIQAHVYRNFHNVISIYLHRVIKTSSAYVITDTIEPMFMDKGILIRLT
ncbi:uncharacterized protein LOC134777201 [Penaeus indicus]|uniref:uncharacterized protein LOC134777201 n=1 Tax=Penaeus indicus TaxID=29960 RepID=UPI00300DB0C4